MEVLNVSDFWSGKMEKEKETKAERNKVTNYDCYYSHM